jgi:autotransporter strand-loop-strand O-heptosyltransferase
MDVYLFPSKKELNPLTIKEALSWDMDVIANYDENYTDQYKDHPNFQLIQNLDVMEYIIQNSPKNSLETQNNINITFHNGVKVEILDDKPSQYNIKCFDQKTNKLIHEDTIKNNMWTSPNLKYFVDWRVEIWENGSKIHEETLNLKNKRVIISFKSKSIGDTIAWFPYVEEFRKKHKCQVICSTFHNDWFKSKYPKIEFSKTYSSHSSIYAIYNIGWFYSKNNKIDNDKHPHYFLLHPLQKSASDILGLNYKEIKPKIKSLPKSSIKEKYVTISIQSTAQCKYWNHPTGWQQVVDFLQFKGYKVAVVDQHREFGVEGFRNTSPTADYYCNDNSLNEVMSIIKGADFHIGLSSGLSWRAWALNTPVVLISSFTKPYCEFTTNCTRVYNDTPTSGYFNTHKLDPSKVNWYPFRNIRFIEDWYEIENITPNQVINEINKLL